MRGPLIVVGDSLLDIDVDGSASRLAPDAPVPVLDDLVEQARPGGAALAAWMAAEHGREVVLLTAIAPDAAGERLLDLLDGRVEVVPLAMAGATPVKKRVRAAGRPVVRLDSGGPPGRVVDDARVIAQVLGRAGAVLVSDYGRGLTVTDSLAPALVAASPGVPVVWDPHPRGTDPVPGVRLATPNAGEAACFVGRTARPSAVRDLGSHAADAEALVARWRAQAVAVTLGERGALLSYGSGVPVVVPAPAVPCSDPCGAGDRFAASAALALAEGLVTTEAVQHAVADAAAYVAAGGPASLTSPTTPAARDLRSPVDGARLAAALAARGGTVVATGGCFDLLHAGHVATLRAARALGDCLVVCLNSDASVRRLKGPGRPVVPEADRVRVLEALECVDAVVVFEEDTPVDVLRRLRPQVWVKGGDYAGSEVPEAAVLHEWGGQTVALPYLEGRSTTRLVEAVATRAASVRADEQQEVRR
jgi:D-beta-D-heptose 7-phosphate kinase / D-beta-D-heptose 1-phosphate adenosyltransferase